MKDLEARFASFVQAFGGELVAPLLRNGGDLPKNADYFFFDRTVIAELKCLEKDYFGAQDAERKFDSLLKQWQQSGLLRSKHVRDGRFSVNDLGETCVLQMLEIFAKPVREAITHASDQIKSTKLHFGLPHARGLILLANDGNRSLSPDLAMHILGRLLKNRFSALNSFVYFAPSMPATLPGVRKLARVWISGPTRDKEDGVDADRLNQLGNAWIDHEQKYTDEPIEKIVIDDHSRVRDIRFLL